MTNNTEKFLEQVREAVATEQLFLPSLPDVAVKVQEEFEKPNATAQSLAETLSMDPALSVRLLQVANSPLYRSRSLADNLQMAITRLGLGMVKNLVISLAMKQIYKASTDVLEERFKELWLASIKTAALSRLLAANHTKLDTELAMLAGLTHNIGALPILLLAEDDDDLFNKPEDLNKTILELQGEVGSHIFKAWHFPQALIDVVSNCMDFSRKNPDSADYVDVVQVALIQGSIFTGLDCPEDWSSIMAFNKLGIDSTTNILDIEENKIIFDETQSLFN
ncbi:MAG: HDOD domain-containing protein [Gammaproteobacteria bacterium]|nr:HDOD domain-containing protein [Gammaproteobacteria bacterium]MCW8909290.1 HDOD domain-containing protein [Gammaproteobacteria bacterium]MCW9003945.1 HDOD domain-containing protein [Gammaproteobacteria bacterium]